jgi:Predicted GTPase
LWLRAAELAEKEIPDLSIRCDKRQNLRKLVIVAKKKIKLELKLVADVAIVGLPSAGKSTLISKISAARPKIADYPFTTLVPNLGVAKIFEREIIFVDIPGLIENAHRGRGLGHKFLRHIERARYLVILIDANSATPLRDVEILRDELQKFSANLAQKNLQLPFQNATQSTKNSKFFCSPNLKRVFKKCRSRFRRRPAKILANF